MYSYEDRIRAVELYIKLGKRVWPTLRQLGKNALDGWCRKYEPRLDSPVDYARVKLSGAAVCTWHSTFPPVHGKVAWSQTGHAPL